MAGLSDPLATLRDWLRARLPTGSRMEVADEQWLDELAESGQRTDLTWGLVVRSLRVSVSDLNTARIVVSMSLLGAWSVRRDLTYIARTVQQVARVARAIQTTAWPSGVDVIEIPEELPYIDRAGITAVEIPVAAQLEMEV